MLENEKIDAEIKNNPEILQKFNEDHGAILVELRQRFELFISSSDIINRYLMCKALMETLEIQGKVAKGHLHEKIQEQGVYIHKGSGTAC